MKKNKEIFSVGSFKGNNQKVILIKISEDLKDRISKAAIGDFCRFKPDGSVFLPDLLDTEMLADYNITDISSVVPM